MLSFFLKKKKKKKKERNWWTDLCSGSLTLMNFKRNPKIKVMLIFFKKKRKKKIKNVVTDW